jgi:alpha-tubulin suppressor-like RCC1 family protein
VNHTCARRSTGRLFCWGASGNGQLGNGNAANQIEMTPDQVAGNRTDWTRVSAGGYHTCARRSNGRLFCWGTNTDGQLGTGGGPSDQDQPVEVAA